MLPFIGFVSLLVAAPDLCTEARNHYESLSPEQALEAADRGLAHGPAPSCLEVRALALLVLGRSAEARAAFEQIFAIDPRRPIKDPSLSPSMRDLIESIREEALPLEPTVRGRWLIHESLRLDLLLAGGLRGATRVRYRATVGPTEHALAGAVVELIGRTVTATLAVPSEVAADRLTVKGTVLDAQDRPVHEFERTLLLPDRPPPREDKVVVVDSGGIGWPIWTGAGLAAAGAVVAIVILAQPRLPSTDNSNGRVQIR